MNVALRACQTCQALTLIVIIMKREECNMNKKDTRPYAEIMEEGIKKQNEEFKNALKRAGWANVEDINWDYDSPEWNKKEEK